MRDLIASLLFGIRVGARAMRLRRTLDFDVNYAVELLDHQAASCRRRADYLVEECEKDGSPYCRHRAQALNQHEFVFRCLQALLETGKRG